MGPVGAYAGVLIRDASMYMIRGLRQLFARLRTYGSRKSACAGEKQQFSNVFHYKRLRLHSVRSSEHNFVGVLHTRLQACGVSRHVLTKSDKHLLVGDEHLYNP